jgi:hypothetical protein
MKETNMENCARQLMTFEASAVIDVSVLVYLFLDTLGTLISRLSDRS